MSNKKCKDCGNEMEMYYTLQCFHCKKPDADKYKRGNLIMAKYWLRNNVPEFNEDKFWDECIYLDIVKSNDSWTSMISKEDLDTWDDDKLPNLKLFVKHFPDEEILWEVSW